MYFQEISDFQKKIRFAINLPDFLVLENIVSNGLSAQIVHLYSLSVRSSTTDTFLRFQSFKLKVANPAHVTIIIL